MAICQLVFGEDIPEALSRRLLFHWAVRCGRRGRCVSPTSSLPKMTHGALTLSLPLLSGNLSLLKCFPGTHRD